jgi:hypothetical protein
MSTTLIDPILGATGLFGVVVQQHRCGLPERCQRRLPFRPTDGGAGCVPN